MAEPNRSDDRELRFELEAGERAAGVLRGVVVSGMGISVALLLASGYEPASWRGSSLLLLEPFAPWGYLLFAIAMCAIGFRIGAPVVRASVRGAIWTCEGRLYVPGVFKVRSVPFAEIRTVRIARAKTFGTRGETYSAGLIIECAGCPDIKAFGRLAEGTWDDVAASVHGWLRACVLGRRTVG